MSDETNARGVNVVEVRRWLARITIEILVGFVGVYAAFALTAYHERQDTIDRRHQIKRALIAEIRPIVALARRNDSEYVRIRTRLDSSIAAGRPAIRPFTEPYAIVDHVWEATKQAGGLTVLDVPTFFAVSNFYNDNSQMLAQYEQLRDLSLNRLLPQLARPEQLLDAATKRPGPLLQLYNVGLDRVGGYNRMIVSDGDSVLAMLARDTL